MKRLFSYAILLSAAVLFYAGAAAAAPLDEVVSGLQDKYNAITTVSAKFTQESYSKTLGTTQSSSGTVYFKKPGKMRWIYSEPVTDELVSDGVTFWMYQPDLAQVIKRDQRGVSSSLAADFLSGIGRLDRDFSIALEKEDKLSYLLGLEPKEPLPNIRKLFLEVDRKTFLVKKTVSEDYFGNTTTVGFKDVKINKDMEDSFFVFTPPEGTSVITQ